MEVQDGISSAHRGRRNLQTEPILLESNDVHVWLACLNRPEPQVKRLEQSLAEEEQRKADRYHCEKDRERFIVARGLLRSLLGRYLKKDPCELCFFYGIHGKPYLSADDRNGRLCFNVARSKSLAAYAFALDTPVGVDIEFIRPDLAVEKIAEFFFSPREVARLRNLPADILPLAFFNCWTRKEAYLKALGDGLTRPLNHVEVSMVPGEPTKLLHVEWDSEEVFRWSLQPLQPAPGYAGALAVYGRGWQLTRVEWFENFV